jgi:hypothetical protein
MLGFERRFAGQQNSRTGFAQILAMKKHFLSIGASRLDKRGRLS